MSANVWNMRDYNGLPDEVYSRQTALERRR
jgi:hypothetical protein